MVKRMPRLALPRNPLIFGGLFAVAVVVIDIAIASAAEGSPGKGIAVFVGTGIYAYLIPVAVGMQMGLLRYYGNLTGEGMFHGPGKTGVAGSTVSTLAMVACCAHHVSDLLPSLGFLLALSSSLTQYKDTIMLAGLLVNVAGSLAILNAIRFVNKGGSDFRRHL